MLRFVAVPFGALVPCEYVVVIPETWSHLAVIRIHGAIGPSSGAVAPYTFFFIFGSHNDARNTGSSYETSVKDGAATEVLCPAAAEGTEILVSYNDINAAYLGAIYRNCTVTLYRYGIHLSQEVT